MTKSFFNIPDVPKGDYNLITKTEEKLNWHLAE